MAVNNIWQRPWRRYQSDPTAPRGITGLGHRPYDQRRRPFRACGRAELRKPWNVHVIGDSSATTQPKAGHIANQEAKVCADALVRSFSGEQPDLSLQFCFLFNYHA
jgi:hypothetical protein